MDHLPVYIGEAAVDAVLTYGQFLVIDAEQVQNCCVKIVAIGFVLLSLIAPIVASAMFYAGLDARAPKPGHEAAAIVVATNRALCEGRASKFRRPDDQGVVGKAAGF